MRKNSLFVGGEQGANRAAILLSMVGSAKFCEVAAWHWLRAVQEKLPQQLHTGADPPDLTDLLPEHWLKAHPEHRWKIVAIRKKELQRPKQRKAKRKKR